MRKQINVILYLVAVTLVVFYGQRFLSTLGSSSGKSPSSRAEDTHMDSDAYYALREVAGVQLGHVSITYRVDEATGRYTPRFMNKACPNPEADPAQLKNKLEALQDELHKQVILLQPGADTDDSGFVSADEGTRFRDLFEFGHLIAHRLESGAVGPAELARAAGMGTDEAARDLQAYRELLADCPANIREYFPVIGK